jgi:type III pantothenate kinase
MKYDSENKNFSLCLDQGNSATKAGVFSGDKIVDFFLYQNSNKAILLELFEKHIISDCILSSVIHTDEETLSIIGKNCNFFIELNEITPVPINNLYRTPETLGKDRLAAIVGASWLQPGRDLLVIDAGTAITYDFIDSSGNYYGGNIAPGVEMRLKALHHFTKKLPLVNVEEETKFLGVDTRSAIQSGVMYGVEFEINGYINTLKIKYPELLTFLTGGSSFYFEEKFKSAIFVERNLVLIGLNRILRHNVQK